MDDQGFTNKIIIVFNFFFLYILTLKLHPYLLSKKICMTVLNMLDGEQFSSKCWHCIKYLFIPNDGLECNISINIYLWEL